MVVKGNAQVRGPGVTLACNFLSFKNIPIKFFKNGSDRLRKGQLQRRR